MSGSTSDLHRLRGSALGRIAMTTCLLAGLVSGCATEAMTQRVEQQSASRVTPNWETEARARAVEIVKQLGAAELPIRSVVACRPPAPAPPGHPRPAAAAFADARITPKISTVHVVAGGGVVEVYGSAREVGRRVRQLHVQGLRAQEYGFDEGGHALANEYRFRAGGALLRLSGQLTPREARAYAVALRRAITLSDHSPVLTRAEEAPCST